MQENGAGGVVHAQTLVLGGQGRGAGCKRNVQAQRTASEVHSRHSAVPEKRVADTAHIPQFGHCPARQ